MPDIRRNKVLFKWDNFFAGLWPMTAVLAIYFQDITASYTLTMSVFSVFGLSQAVLEIPTGFFSDKIGRRQTLILSALFILICLILWAFAGHLRCIPLLFAGAVLYGASDALMSGTLDALMFETMQEIGEERDFKLIYARSRVYNQAGLIISVLIATAVLYFQSLQFLAWLSVLPMTGQLVVSFFYVNPSRNNRKTSEKHELNLKKTLCLFWQNKKLRFFSLIEILDTSFYMTINRFEGVYFENLITVWAVNLARACKQIAGMTGYALMPVFNHIRSLKILFGSVLWSAVFCYIALFFNTVLSPFVMALSNLSFGLTETTKEDLLQKEYLPEQRAMMGSLLSLLTAGFQSVVCAASGMAADIFGVRNALFCLIFCRLTVCFLCTRKILGKNKKFC